MTDKFLTKFCNYYNVPLNSGIELVQRMEKVHFQKGEILVRPGEKNTDFFLIAEGCWRGYYYQDGVDTTLWFAIEGEAVMSTWGYVANENSLIYVEALSNSILYKISKTDLEDYFYQSIENANIGRKLFERQFLYIDQEILTGGDFRAKERYLTLLNERPELFQHVPLKYIASYLKITPQSLSRLRSNIARKSK